jgi:hypothetical protein
MRLRPGIRETIAETTDRVEQVADDARTAFGLIAVCAIAALLLSTAALIVARRP